MTAITFTIPNISCNHCVNTIKNELSELPGVKSVVVDLPTKKVVVTFESPATTEQIEESLVEINYPPKIEA